MVLFDFVYYIVLTAPGRISYPWFVDITLKHRAALGELYAST